MCDREKNAKTVLSVKTTFWFKLEYASSISRKKEKFEYCVLRRYWLQHAMTPRGEKKRAKDQGPDSDNDGSTNQGEGVTSQDTGEPWGEAPRRAAFPGKVRSRRPWQSGVLWRRQG